jgi:hypothetical protein
VRLPDSPSADQQRIVLVTGADALPDSRDDRISQVVPLNEQRFEKLRLKQARREA